MCPDGERGFVLVWVLALLLAGSSPLLLSTATRSRTPTVDSAVLRSLTSARQALIAYAVNYTDLYGPRSAGPGHFPCPDTDADVFAGEALLSGPNPPCGSRSISAGRLPSRVVAGRGYYAFHQETDQRLWYAVDANFINNPTNRRVNSQSQGRIRLPEANDVIAVIVHPAHPHAAPSVQSWQTLWKSASENSASVWGAMRGVGRGAERDIGRSTGRGTERVFITMADLRQPLLRRVGAWLVDRIERVHDHPCATLPATTGIEGVALLDWLRDRGDLMPGDACVEANPRTLEQVPLTRHWLVRNQWLSLISLTIDKQCLARPAACEAQLSGTADATVMNGAPAIELALVPR